MKKKKEQLKEELLITEPLSGSNLLLGYETIEEIKRKEEEYWKAKLNEKA